MTPPRDDSRTTPGVTTGGRTLAEARAGVATVVELAEQDEGDA